MIIEMLPYFVVLSYLSVFLCRDSNCQGFVHSLAQTLQQAIYIERIRLPFMPLNFSCMFMFGITSEGVSVLINNFLMYRYISYGN